MKPITTKLKKPGYEIEYDYIPLTATPEQVYLSTVFAKSYTEVRAELYAKKRNQTDPKTIEDQTRASKIFEYMIYNYYTEFFKDKEGVEITPPSIEIYSGKKRPSFDDDLTIISDKGGKLPIHIKTHDLKRISKRLPLSWGFQVEDPLFIKKANDVLVLGILVDDFNGRLVSRDYVKNYREHLGEPKSPKFIGKKKFLYYDSSNTVFRLFK